MSMSFSTEHSVHTKYLTDAQSVRTVYFIHTVISSHLNSKFGSKRL